MMFGTVMISQQQNQQISSQGPINSISQAVASSQHNHKIYQQSSSIEASYVVDERPTMAPALPKPTSEPPSLRAGLAASSESTANNLRKQQSHQYQHNQNRSVNFDGGTAAADQDNEYAKIKLEKRQAKRESRRQQRQHLQEEQTVNDEKESVKNIQVQILPQDDNWGENTTAFTADFSDIDNMTEDGRSGHFNFNSRHKNNHLSDLDQLQLKSSNAKSFSPIIHRCTSHFGLICAFCLALCAFATPFLFIILPRLWDANSDCGLECEGLLVGLAFKLFLLLVAVWTLYARKPRIAQLPRFYELHSLFLLLLAFTTLAYWLLYAVRIVEERVREYSDILEFTARFVDVLLGLFVVAVLVLYLRPVEAEFVVRCVRSPDGEQAQYTIGRMSIQRAAIWILEQYYKDFCVYNPWLENSRRKSVKNGPQDDDCKSMRSGKSRLDTASMIGGNIGANERFYEEYEFERRLRKRRARLLTTTEQAFGHVRRVQNEIAVPNENGLVPALMDPYEAAQAVFTSIARDLRRYLRVTRQQPYFTRDSIVAHLANCISYDMSPKSFLQRYLQPEPLVFNERALESASSQQREKLNGIGSHGVNYSLNLKTLDQSWILICDTPLYQNCEDNLMFVLKQNEVSIMCSFKRIPRFSLIEDILDPMRNKFTIKFNSETTV